MSAEFAGLPVPLQQKASSYWHALPASLIELLTAAPSELSSSFLKTCLSSDYFYHMAKSHPEFIEHLITSGQIHHPVDLAWFENDAKQLAQASVQDMMGIIRRYRHQVYCHCYWRDIAGWANLSEVFATLTQFADFIVTVVMDRLHELAFASVKTSEPMPKLLVLALGKYGGEELNYSSDIDLILTFARTTAIQGVEPASLFTRLARQLIDVLQQPTQDGFVFRVDLRLRPFGDSGPLCMSLPELNHYYQTQGREWERYALVKQRVVYGWQHDATRLQHLILPFVYHRYVDYSSIESLRQMKQLMAREMSHRGLHRDIKRCAGGIREVEFFVQSFQLIYGGQDVHLQQRSLLSSLAYLQQRFLPAETVTELRQAYQFYRQLEHRLQMFHDQQTHQLPQQHQSEIAYALGYDKWDDLLQQLERHQHNVRVHYDKLLQYNDETLLSEQEQQQFSQLWQQPITASLLQACFPKLQDQAESMASELQRLRQQSKQRSERANAWLQNILPVVLHSLAQQPQPQALSRFCQLLDRSRKRGVYLSLMAENRQIIPRLLSLLASSGMIADTLIQYPYLLAELIEQNRAVPKSHATLLSECQQLLLACAEDDVDEQLEMLRSFKHRQTIQIAIAECEKRISNITVSEQLTLVAEVIIQHVYQLAKTVASRRSRDDTSLNDQLAVIAYGKCGSRELSYQSDLDLVFVHENAATGDMIAIVQRMLHMLTASLHNGVLYTIDTRLRPSGTSGLLVQSYEAFQRYQVDHAWTYEHQALVKARMIIGSDQLKQQFNTFRQQQLCQPRDSNHLRREIAEMRQKMRDHVGTDTRMSTLKQALIDIEFIVQYAILANSHQHPELSENVDNLQSLQQLKVLDILPESIANDLIQAYLMLRHEMQQWLLKTSDQAHGDLEAHQKTIAQYWQEIFLGA